MLPMLLAGDIGGTKTVVALCEPTGAEPRVAAEQIYASREHASLEAILALFLADHPAERVEAACFAVAGPVVGGRVHLTNLAWETDEAALARACGARRVRLVNDQVGAAVAMPTLARDARALLQPGLARAEPENAALIAAGTGLGQALLVWDGERHVPVASEGGHADFAPRNELEIDLLRYLRAELGGRVSVEAVVSGPGLLHIYRFLRSRARAPEPDWLAAEIAGGDASAAVSRAALAARDPVCVESLDLFAALYGAEAGNLALRCLALGGVYVAGGIAPKILPALRAGSFLAAFADKGRFSEVLRGVEVSVSLDVRAPLRGAAQLASRMAASSLAP